MRNATRRLLHGNGRRASGSAALCAALTFALQMPSAAQGQAQVWIVDASGTSLTDVQSAVDLAASGDIVLVEPGVYAGFAIDAKALTLVGRADVSAGEFVEIGGEVVISNLAAGDAVVIQGEAFAIRGQVGHALEVRDSLGSVRLQGLELEGACGSGGADGYSGLALDAAADVSAVSVLAIGGHSCEWPGAGGAAIRVDASNVALYDVTAGGGNGTTDDVGLGSTGSAGGAGALVQDGFLFASLSRFQGGGGGDGSSGFGNCATGGIQAGSGGDGGDGLVLASAQASARVMDTLRDGGLGGLLGAGTACTSADGAAGQGESVAAGATFVVDPKAARITRSPVLSHELGGILFQFEGEPGDKVYFFLSTAAQFADSAPFSGVTLTKPPHFYRVLMGTVPLSGVLDAGIGVGDLGAGVEGVVYFGQAFVRTVAKKRVVGGPATLVILDSQF